MLKHLIAAVLATLSLTAFAAVDLNKATQADLESIKGIGPAMSTKILDERKKAPFKDWGDLVGRVKGVGAGNATKFSSQGLTVNGEGFRAGADAKPAADKKVAKADKPAVKGEASKTEKQ